MAPRAQENPKKIMGRKDIQCWRETPKKKTRADKKSCPRREVLGKKAVGREKKKKRVHHHSNKVCTPKKGLAT